MYPNLILKLMVNNQYVKQQTQWGEKFNDKSFFVLNFLDKMLFLKAQVASGFMLTYDYCVLDGTKCFAGASTIQKNKYIKLFKHILSRIPLFCSIFMEKTMSISFALQRCFSFFLIEPSWTQGSGVTSWLSEVFLLRGSWIEKKTFFTCFSCLGSPSRFFFSGSSECPRVTGYPRALPARWAFRYQMFLQNSALWYNFHFALIGNTWLNFPRSFW